MRYPFEHNNVVHVEFSIVEESFTTRRIDDPRIQYPTPHQVAQRQSEILAGQYERLAEYHKRMAELLAEYDYVDIVNSVHDVMDFISARQVLITRFTKIGHGIKVPDDAPTPDELYDALHAAEIKVSSVAERIYESIYGPIPEVDSPYLPLHKTSDSVVKTKFFRAIAREHAESHGVRRDFYKSRNQPHRTAVFFNHTALAEFASTNGYRLGVEEGDGCGPLFHGIKVVGTWEHIPNNYGLDKWKAKVRVQ